MIQIKTSYPIKKYPIYRKFFDLFETNNFSYFLWFGQKIEFLIYYKAFSINKTRTIGQKWLANELDLHFSILKEYTKGQSNLLIFSKVIVLTDYR